MNTKQKEYFMNNIKKIGLTALASSLVSLGSVNAGEMSVSGGINTTLKFGKGGGNTGRSIGADRDFTVSGGGELDNGTTFSMSSTTNDDLGLSASTTTITTPSMGTFTFGSGTGGHSGAYDEEVPQAYEQVSDAKETMANQVGNFMDNNFVGYTSPTLEMMGATITAHLEYSPQASDGDVGDGGSVSYNATIGAGKAAGITIGYEGLKLGFYGAERLRTTPKVTAGTGNYETDEFNGVWYAKYSMGPVSIGYSESYMDAGVTQALGSETVNTAKAERTAGGIFTGEQMSIAFNVNDNMSISYTTSDETYDTQDDAKTAATTDDDVTESIDAIQVAYSMGGMSIKAYNMEVSNPDQDDDAADQSVTEIALGFAF
jgi:outer membrane protein OmpU